MDRFAPLTLRRLLCTSALLLGLALAVPPAIAQQEDTGNAPATLIADRVSIDADGVLVASGQVEAMQGEYHLKASRITYDPETETLGVEGPIVIQQGANAVVLADSAELSTDLREGLISSARVVLDQQMQIAAVEINRVNGRYSQLYNTVASSCEVCAARPVPLWQIRSQRVVHDEVEHQIYFENAFFEVMGIPVFYLPYLRMPDPTLKRTTGFLTPSVHNSTELGYGVKYPYFITLGDHRDLTVTPFFANATRTLELRYRQAFRAGRIEFNGAVSSDDLQSGLRSYLFGVGYFRLPHDFALSFDIETTSDPDYLNDYDYSGKDRLDSAIKIQRTSRDRLFSGEIVGYESLRSEDNNQTQPYRVGDLTWRRRTEPAVIGGVLTYGIDLHGHQRRSDENIVGRDVGRITGQVGWDRDWVGPWGMLFDTELIAMLDHTVITHDNTYDSPVTQVIPFGVAEMRWPWIKQGTRASHVIEPVVQLVWSPSDLDSRPVDESTQLEFDAGNLFSTSRFPAYDAFEEGLRANLGFSWTRYDPAGWSLRGMFGRILREEDLGQFTGYEILDGRESDWLTEVQFDISNRFSVANRATFTDEFDFSRNELRAAWNGDGLDLAGSFIWLEASETESRFNTIREWSLEADWDVNKRLETSLDMRYDTLLDRAASTRLGLLYKTECVDFGLSVFRRFTEFEQDEPDMNVSFQVDLAGIGDTGNGRTRPVRLGCRG